MPKQLELGLTPSDASETVRPDSSRDSEPVRIGELLVDAAASLGLAVDTTLVATDGISSDTEPVDKETPDASERPRRLKFWPTWDDVDAGKKGSPKARAALEAAQKRNRI